ncbi:uncharacterized protein C8Q71DRAFT_733990 [Rhodofomes roseus]|uniref:Uncharacterized protein n=1 Tax=Rhodofomes roseus TaxID=34475 RepID=A0ABQ8KWL8_9APHY|nr:uncharacterized protein C8Q71DRAFT_733990 [Rhodofomes roseus]KAH9842695.1 hypothetical protein C8Q71DRAFT_733990 [Rhodofomes roseus]
MLVTTLANVELPPIFSRVRLIAFALMTMLSLVGTTLLCVELFVRVDVTDNSQRNIVLLLILINSCTSIMFPAMLLVQYTPLWEAARLLCLVFFQIGSSGVFTAWYAAFRCPDPVATCRRINMAILASVWVIPTLLLMYSGTLAAMVYWGWKHPEFQTAVLREKRESELPMMSPPPEQLRIRSSTFADLLEAGGMGSKAPDVPVPPLPHAPEAQKRNSAQSAKSTSSRSSNSSGRLTKGKPKYFY